ncbi:MAG: S8 family serine peptidase [Clostridia bacterium]
MIAKISPKLFCDYFSEKKYINAIVSYNPKVRCYIKDKGVRITERFPFAHCVAIEMEKNNLFSLSKNVNVNYISSVQEVSSQIELTKKIMSVDKISSNKFNGEGQTLCFIDTGICPHIDFCLGENRIKHFEDLINHRQKAYDDNGHGTMVAGMAIGSGLTSCGKYCGIAPRAKVVAVKSMNEDGAGSSMDILRGMQWVYDNRRKYGINVLCMSLGAESMGSIDPLMQGAETLCQAGICVVTASGNSGGKSTIKSPGISPQSITAGSFDDFRTLSRDDDKVAAFSSCGPTVLGSKPDLLVNGVNICGASDFSLTKNMYETYSGTSVSAAVLAGVCLILSQKLKTNNVANIKNELKKFCVKKENDENVEGAGYLYFN